MRVHSRVSATVFSSLAVFVGEVLAGLAQLLAGALEPSVAVDGLGRDSAPLPRMPVLSVSASLARLPGPGGASPCRRPCARRLIGSPASAMTERARTGRCAREPCRRR